MEFRARFAPSPTGQVHIGNIRTAIFNWLCTRHVGGTFLLRIEDTDLERSTQEAINTLLDCMKWLGLDYDEEPMYQTRQADKHHAAAATLMNKGVAYRLDPSQEASPIYFRIPYHCEVYPFVRTVGPAEIALAPETDVTLSRAGLHFMTLSAKGKPVENQGCLAGFQDLVLEDASGHAVFRLDNEEKLKELEHHVTPTVISQAVKIKFVRREVFYHDMVKGELAKPLDSIKDFIIVRSDSSPVFHLANVWDDIEQKVTHIVRGDDHVENTYRHLFLFACLGYNPPAYAHLPMIINAQGKPYSKRDGDAFVGDFKNKGFLPEALFNYLSLLGWSPGDNREKMSVKELIEAFDISRAQHTPAQFDYAKLSHMNGLYLAEMSVEKFAQMAWEFAEVFPWRAAVKRDAFDCVAALMQSRTKTFADVNQWIYFFTADFEYDSKSVAKFLKDPATRAALELLTASFAAGTLSEQEIESAIRAAEIANGMKEGKLNQPLRIAVTGISIGIGVYETIAMISSKEAAARIRKALTLPL